MTTNPNAVAGSTVEFQKYLDARFELVVEKVDTIKSMMSEGFGEFKRIADDHELRLRAQHDTDIKQGLEINNLNVRIAEMQGSLALVSNDVKSLTRSINDQQLNQQSTANKILSTLLVEGTKALLFGGGLTGAAYFIGKSTGLIP